MTDILVGALLKFCAEKIGETSIEKAVGPIIDSSREGLLELSGHLDPDLAEILQQAIAGSYVEAVIEIAENYLELQKQQVLRREIDTETEDRIREGLHRLRKRPTYQIAPALGNIQLAPGGGFDDDQTITDKLLARVKDDLGELSDGLKSAFKRRVVKLLRQKLWIHLTKSLKKGNGSALMSAFMFDLLQRVGQSADITRLQGARLAEQLILEFQLDRFGLDKDLVRIKTRLFVNRQNVFSLIDDFLKTDSGYFVVRAQGGMGKTAFAAKYILENSNCIYHFLNRELGPGDHVPQGYITGAPRNTTESCIGTLCQQLQDWLGVPATVNTDPLKLDARFGRLLEMKVQQRATDKLVIVIDGIDEARDLRELLNFFPKQPRSQTYFIFTCRPLVSIPGINASETELGCLGTQDIRDMLVEVNAALALNDDFIENLEKVTGGEPLYLYHVVEEAIRRGEEVWRSLDDIPSGAIKNLEGYYRWQLERLTTVPLGSDQLGQDALDLLRLLALLKESVTEAQLKNISGIYEIRYTKAFGLAQRYLMRRLSIGGKPIYSLFHRRFQEVVKEHYRRNASKDERMVYLNKVLDYCRKWQERRSDADDGNDYIFRHYAEHLLEFGEEKKDFGQLFDLLSNRHFLKAKLERMGQYSALLPDIQIGIDKAASEELWDEALRLCLLEGYFRGTIKNKWRTGAILLDAASGAEDSALDEAREISERDERGLQLLLIAEWLLRSGVEESVRKALEVIDEAIQLWLERRLFVTYDIEEEIMDLVTNLLFKIDENRSRSFLQIINTPGTPDELSLLLVLARLDRDGAFEDPPDAAVTEEEYSEIISAAAAICSTLVNRWRSPYREDNEPPLTQSALADRSLASLFFYLATGASATDIDPAQFYAISDERQRAGLADVDCILAALKGIWRHWQQYCKDKKRTELPGPQEFTAHVEGLAGFMPIYAWVRSCIPVLNKDHAEKIVRELKGRQYDALPFMDVLWFYLTKEAASQGSRIAESTAKKIRRRVLRALAFSYVIEAGRPESASGTQELAVRLFSDLQERDTEVEELLVFDYRDEVIHALSVIDDAGDGLDWARILPQHFSQDELPLIEATVKFGRRNGKPVAAEETETGLRAYLHYPHEDEDFEYAAGYLAELVKARPGHGLGSLNRLLTAVQEYSDRKFEGSTTMQRLLSGDNFSVFLENVANDLSGDDLDRLLAIVETFPSTLPKRLRVLSFIAVRSHSLGNHMAEMLIDRIIGQFKELINAGPRIRDFRREIVPTVVNIHQVSRTKSSTAFELLVNLLGLETLAQQEALPSGSYLANLFYLFASLAGRIERHDNCERYLEIADRFAKEVTNWADEVSLDRIGLLVEQIPNRKIMNSLFILLRSSKQFESGLQTYQKALAHAAAHFTKGLIRCADWGPLRQIAETEKLLDHLPL
jgi:hypothetical protein